MYYIHNHIYMHIYINIYDIRITHTLFVLKTFYSSLYTHLSLFLSVSILSLSFDCLFQIGAESISLCGERRECLCWLFEVV